MMRCTVCDMPKAGVETAEVGESGNWIRGPFCQEHLQSARKYGRVTNSRKPGRGERVEKPSWAEDWQYEAPGQPPEDTEKEPELSEMNYNELKKRAVDEGLEMGMAPTKDELVEALR